ncbi:hypothetical protein EX30DRAFT_99090 [Ascodesmis nigricans]|uniref:Uncharacterized protein n=1 Tax=Ascodesmis nigricans TaxID=341454 RepID=A0A4S2N4L5_9PEZI|nr:hypothetical protein EX30DRAFT_99090 [Ascodesmis nigricans]
MPSRIHHQPQHQRRQYTCIYHPLTVFADIQLQILKASNRRAGRVRNSESEIPLSQPLHPSRKRNRSPLMTCQRQQTQSTTPQLILSVGINPDHPINHLSVDPQQPSPQVCSTVAP